MTDTLMAAVESGLAEIKSHTDSRIADLERQIIDIAQKNAPPVPGLMGTSSGGGAAAAAAKIAAVPELKAWAAGEGRLAQRVSVDIALKGLMTKADPITSGSATLGMVQPDRQAGIVPLVSRRRWIWDFIPNQTTAVGSIEYLRETGDVRVSGIQAGEGAKKQDTGFTFEVQRAPVITLAHFTKMSRQVFADMPMLQSFVRDRLMQGCWLKLEAEILNGAGGSDEMAGILHPANHVEVTPGSGKPVDIVRQVIGQMQDKDYSPSLLLLNPRDWASIELSRAPGSGEYDAAIPSQMAAPVLWGLNVHTTRDIAQGRFVVLDAACTMLWMREAAQLLLGTEGDDFTRNVITALCEMRSAFGVLRPEGIYAGSFPS